MTTLTFLGGVGEVTGSRYLLENGRSRILLECGLRQGGRNADRINRTSLRALARSLDAVVLSHAHLDHSGLLPKLVRDGYRGPIYCTPETRELLVIMLRDSAHLMTKDIEWENKWRRRAGKRLLEPVYDQDDVDETLAQCITAPYGKPCTVTEWAGVIFRDAGHIIGSAIVEIALESGGRQRRLVFSGDLGNANSVLMRSPETVEAADLLLLESTYGNRDHRSPEETVEEFAQVLARAHEEGGNVLIPAFAVGRTQEILYHLAMLHHQGRLPQRLVFLDSPMAIEVTELYRRREKSLDPKDLERLRAAAGTAGNGELFPFLQYSRTTEDSMALNRIQGGAIIIAGSGMCEGGRIRHHFKYHLWRPQTHLVIVGFQARGTLGRRLVDGAERIKVLGAEVAVRAKIHTIGGFSAHAGRSQLLDWAAHFKTRPACHLVHGEDEARAALAAALHERLGMDARLPGPGETIEI